MSKIKAHLLLISLCMLIAYEATEAKTSCFDCYKETICDISTQVFLYEAIDIGLVNSTPSWLVEKYPTYNLSHYLNDSCRQNRVRKLLAALFILQDPVDNSGCSGSNYCQANGCSNDLKKWVSFRQENSTNNSVAFKIHRIKILSLLSKTILYHKPGGKKSYMTMSNHSVNTVDLKHINPNEVHLPQNPDLSCLPQREFSTIEKVSLLVDVAKGLYHCGMAMHSVSNVNAHASSHDTKQEEYILTKLETFNRLVLATAMIRPTYSIKSLQKTCGEFADDLLIAKAFLITDASMVLVHCDRCSNVGLFNNSAWNSTSSHNHPPVAGYCQQQQKYLAVERHLSIARSLVSTSRESFDCWFSKERCVFISQESVTSKYQRIRDLLGCYRCNDTMAQCNASLHDCVPDWKPSKKHSLHTVRHIARNTLNCNIQSHSLKRGNLERGLQNMINFHRILQREAERNSSHQFKWPNCPADCATANLDSSMNCDLCHALALNKVVSSLTTRIFNCKKTFRYQGQIFCKPQELETFMSRCLVNYTAEVHYTNETKELVSLFIAISSLIGCSSSQSGNAFANHQPKCLYLSKALRIAYLPATSYPFHPSWIMNTKAFQPTDSTKTDLREIHKITQCSQQCNPWEEFCPTISQCLPALLICQPITRSPLDQLYTLIGQVDMTSLLISSFFVSEFTNETIVVFNAINATNDGHFIAYLPSGATYNITGGSSGIVLSQSSYLKFHSHVESSYGMRVLYYYRLHDLGYATNHTHNSTTSKNHTNSHGTWGNFTAGAIVNVNNVARKPRTAALLINPIARIQHLKLKSVLPKFTIKEDSQTDLTKDGFHISKFLDLKAVMKNHNIPRKMFPFIPSRALDTYQQYLFTYAKNQPYVQVVSQSKTGHWQARYTDARNQPHIEFLNQGVSFPLYNSDVYLHPSRDYYGTAWLHLNVCYCKVLHERHNRLSFNATFEVLTVNDKPIAIPKFLVLPAISYNLTTSPNNGFSMSQLRYYASDIDSPVLGIAVLAASKSNKGSWMYKQGNASWLPLSLGSHRSSQNPLANMDMFRLMPHDRLKFELVDASMLWSQAKEVWLQISFWDMADGKNSGNESISMANFTTSSSYSAGIFCYLARRGCDGKTASLAKIDACGVCGGTGRCKGCDGVPFSGARYDSCGVCTGGTTNKTFNHMKDCAGTCGKAQLDTCNVCQRKDKVRDFKDCMGVCFGKAKRNRCDQCYDGTSSLNATAGMDVCGVCNGDGKSCQGCDGVYNSGRVLDSCGSCLLKTDSLFNANCTKITGFSPRNSPSQGGTNMDVLGAGFSLYRNVSCYFQNGNTTVQISIVLLSLRDKSKFRITTPSASPGTYILKCTFDDNGIVYESSPSTLRFYSKSSIRINGLSVNRIPINTATNITITGEGFDQTDVAFCVLMPSNNLPIIIQAPTFNRTTAECPLPRFSYSINLQVTVIAVREDGTPNALKSIPSNSSLTIQIYAPTPLPILAQFSGKLDMVLITFDTNLRIHTTDCWRIFRADVAGKFGKRPRCYLKSLRQMIIRLGLDASLEAGNVLVFNTGALLVRNQKIVASENRTITVQSPVHSDPLVVHLYGPTKLGTCESLRIKAGITGSTGRRKSRIGWRVDFASGVDRSSYMGVHNISLIQQYLASLEPHSHQIFIPASRILFSSSSGYLGYEFFVNVTNSLGQTSNETSLVVERINTDLPTVTIIGGSKRTVKSFRNLVLRAYARKSPCQPKFSKSLIAYQWKVSSPLIALDARSKNTPRLFIPRKTLQGGSTYVFTLNASMFEDPTVFSSASVKVTVDNSPLVAKITGGSNRVIGSNSDVILDASSSYDPDRDTLTPESYSWECYSSSSDPCFVPDLNNTERMARLMILPVKRAILMPGTLVSNETYTFVFTYNKGFRSTSKTIKIRINQGSPPLVFIRPQRNSKANANRKIVIKGYVKTTSLNTAVWWECVEEAGFSYVNLTDPGVTRRAVRRTIKRRGTTWFVLVFNPNILENGALYKFKLQSSNADGIGFAETVISINGPPALGAFTTDIPQGIALDTEFRLQALHGWIDDQDDNSLKYNFGYIKPNGQGAFLGSASLDNELTTFLPAGQPQTNFTLPLFVDVSDKSGATTRAMHYVRVLPPTEISLASVTGLASKIQTAFLANDLSSVIGQISSTVNVLNQAGHLDMMQVTSMMNISSGVYDEIVKFKENMTSGVLMMLYSVLDRKAQDIVLNLMSDLTRDGKLFNDLLKTNVAQSIANLVKQQIAGTAALPPSPSKMVFAALEEEEESEEEEGKTPEEIAEIMQTYENIINASSFDNTAKSMKKSFTKLINSLLSSMCKSSSYGEEAAVSESTLSSLQSYKSDFSDDYNSTMAINCKNCSGTTHGSPILSLGEDLTRKYESWQCTSDYTCNGACLGSVQFPEDLFSKNQENETVSQIVQISLFNPESSQIVQENQLTSPMTILIPAKPNKLNNSYSTECKYWDDISEEWKNDSCIAEQNTKVVNGTTYIVCKCTRTGAIAAFQVEPFQHLTEQTKTKKNDTASSKPNKSNKTDPLIPLYVVLGILGLAAVIGGSIYAFKKRRAAIQQTSSDE